MTNQSLVHRTLSLGKIKLRYFVMENFGMVEIGKTRRKTTKVIAFSGIRKLNGTLGETKRSIQNYTDKAGRSFAFGKQK